MYLKIYYKKMLITWVLSDFEENELENIANYILQMTKNVTYYKMKHVLKCTRKDDLNKIYSILKQRYLKHEKYKKNDKVIIDYAHYWDML